MLEAERESGQFERRVNSSEPPLAKSPSTSSSDLVPSTPTLSKKPAGSFRKRLMDLVIAVPLLVFLSPLMILIALIIKVSDRGPIIFRQTRYGLNGKPFMFYKFRTMHINADTFLQDLLSTDPEAASEWASFRKLRKDPRITRFGHFLRISSLDELPQFYNILRGEMSAVGPRPMVQGKDSNVDDRGLYGPDFRYYVMTRPGITGLWQVSGRASTTFEERVRLDVKYVTTWSITQDFKILWKTIPTVLFNRGAF